MQTGLRELSSCDRSLRIVRLLILLAFFGILNVESSIVKADELHAHPSSVVFNAVQGIALNDTRSIFTFSLQGDNLDWTLSKDASWILPDKLSGQDQDIVKISVNTSGLSSGIYNGNVTIVSAESTADPVVISVTLIINPNVPVKATTWENGYSSAMSVSVDDSQPSGFDELVANGVIGTYAGWGTVPASFYTAYYNAGMELACHTVNHICRDLPDDVLRTQEIEPNIQGLATYTPEPARDIITFVWPCGSTNYREEAVASDYFLSSRGYNWNMLEDATPVNFMDLKSFNSHEHTPYPPADLKTVVDDAINQKKWFNLVLHNFNNDDGAVTYAHNKDIWVTSIGNVIKYILQRDRFILTDYNSATDNITFNVSRIQIPATSWREFESAFGMNDVTTLQIDVDDIRTVDNVLVDGVSNPFQLKTINGNIVVQTNVKLDYTGTKNVNVVYHPTTIGLTITGVSANNKVYDGNTSAVLNTSGAVLSGVVAGDVVTLITSGATGTFSGKNAGTGKTVITSGFALGGTDAVKYSLTQPVTTADITKANLSITGITANNKVYNSNTIATLNTVSAGLSGIIGTDVVTLNSTAASGNFSNKNIGTGKTVSTAGFILEGADAGNYNFSFPSLTADITVAPLTVTGVTANNKVYDGTTTATINTAGALLAGVAGSDIITLNSGSVTGTFADPNIGAGKVVTISGFTVSGTDLGNYTFTQPTVFADITGVLLTVTGVTANDKEYDGSTSATINKGSAVLVGVVSGDVVTLVTTGAAGTFVNKNAGPGKTVNTSGFTLSGADAGKYTVIQPSAIASITKASLSVTGVTANSRPYNGTTGATLNTSAAALAGVFGTDVVSLIKTGASGIFQTKNAGTGIPVTITGFTLGGTDAVNYNLTQPSSTADITRAVLTISGVTANNKIYDGTTAATLNTGSAALVGVISGDAVTLNSSGATGTFNDKNIGTGKIVTTTGFIIGGSGSGNYTLTQPTATADILGIALTVTGITANNKIYNGTSAATLNTSGATLTGVIPGDIVSLILTGASGTFANKNAGTGKVVSISGLTLSGADAAKYSITQPSATANITKAGLTISGVSAVSRIYNGTTAATLNTGSAALTGVFSGDIVTLVSAGATGTFASRNAGSSIVVTTSGFTTSGADAGNYNLTQPSVTADITTAVLTISGVSALNRTYDRTATATLNTSGAVLTGVYGSDAVTLNKTGATGTFANKNAGTSKLVTTSGFTLVGSDSGNYSLSQPTATADIAPVPLNVTGITADNKIYDGTTSAVVNSGGALLSGVLTGDNVTLLYGSVTGTFPDKNAGTGKTVSISGISLGGADSGNYTLNPPLVTANITKSGLTVSGITADSRPYNNTTTATLQSGSATLQGIIGTDAVNLISSEATGTFADRHVGQGITVLTSGFTLGGPDAVNYSLSQPVLVADISAASLGIMGLSVSDKVYDGTTNATLNKTGAILTGVYGSDIVSLVAGSGVAVIIEGFSISGADQSNYFLTQPSVTGKILPAAVSVTGITAGNKVYDGSVDATLSFGNISMTGILSGDVVNLITAGATGAFEDKNAGNSKKVIISGLTLTGVDAGNYFFPGFTITADIAKAVLTISGTTAQNKIYDGTTTASLNIVGSTLQGAVGGDDLLLNSTGARGSFSDKNAGTAKNVAISGFSISGSDTGNYTLLQPALTCDILPKPVTITANDMIKHFNADLIFTGTEISAAGLVSGDALPVVTLSSPGAVASADVGKYDISVSGANDNNYVFTYIDGTLTVGKSELIVTAENKTKVYGSENPELTVSYSGFFKNDNASVVDVLPVVTSTAGTMSDAGTYPITLSGGSDNNYDIILVNGTLNILKAPLTITAEDKRKHYGESNPDLTINYSGFVAGQDSSVLDALPIAQTDVDTETDAGVYDINVAGASASNYSFVYDKGIFTIDKADQVITFAQIPGNLHASDEYTLEATSSSGLTVSFEVSDPTVASINGNILSVEKEGTVTIKGVQQGDRNWNPAAEISQTLITLPEFGSIPSLFTPNSDGVNDHWYIPDIDRYGKVVVTIYNRYGQTVYQSDAYKNDWDGTWNGTPLPSASYYYIIKSTSRGLIKGVVNILR
jgi:gliding motility-associated-like protein